MLDDSGSVEYNLYILCLFDLLGQTNKLKVWEKHPTDRGQFKQAMTAMAQTALSIAAYRKTLQSWVEESQRIYEEMQPIGAKDCAGDLVSLKTNVKIQQFADTFLLVAPLINKTTNGQQRLNFVQIDHIFSMCAVQMINSLATNHPVRGAITVGTGMWIDDQRFYGPALAQAHYLESRIAKYPRIVVSDKVVKLMDEGTDMFGASIDLFDVFIRPRIKQYIMPDDDGYLILDFMGPQAQHDFCTLRENVERAYKSVKSCKQEFRQCKKLGPRYAKLLKYMVARRELWGLNCGDS